MDLQNAIRVENGKVLGVFPTTGSMTSIDLMKKLWENSSPLTAFAAQTITVPGLSQYSHYFIVAGFDNASAANNLCTTSNLTERGSHCMLSVAYTSHTLYRLCKYGSVTDTIEFSAANYDATTNNKYLIPRAVYGVNAKVSIDTIARDVSIQASNCMLSDGETSVEDALDDIENTLDEKINVSKQILTATSWQSSGASNLSFFSIPNVASGFAPIAKIVNSDGSFTVYGFLSTGFYKATFNSSGVYQSNVKIG